MDAVINDNEESWIMKVVHNQLSIMKLQITTFFTIFFTSYLLCLLILRINNRNKFMNKLKSMARNQLQNPIVNNKIISLKMSPAEKFPNK